ncbi:hypothetical protein IFM61606_01071 [Aspergillus udagawae]|uniref:Leucine rich repeat protein n=1 Tax=Aspergillus udagawae TaxID=91492 RepID=A0ABQ1A9T6_9EURO|nr:hypothetical protein IFM51744_01306 [Aspergillus udagawae]GFF77010.1 hypothetical protein IFM53868_01981 [Aspergillus udagawae]GFG04670.1 hypothetical protein IFM5058_02044 [Aspergillus udagawae]GFG21169.1 hypothetical protein IFM61606_01071 [Aspergillus udagawae]
MGKLNYSARKITGLKAGQVVSKDLKKRITPGVGAKAAARDPNVEIDVSGKELTDEGFAEFVDDLVACMKYRDEEHPEGSAKVIELHLQGNQLTVVSLRKLSEVIKLSIADLRELDISHNNLVVCTSEEQEIWYDFLDSFKNCFLLKKFDIGNNPLGPKGIEVLARVYMQSDLDFLEADADVVVGMDSEGDHEGDATAEGLENLKINGKDNEATKNASSKQSPKKSKVAQQNGSSHAACATKKLTYAELKRYACTRGLRSIPFLIISNTNLTSSCAVHLSSMLSMHRSPEQLLAFLPSGKGPILPVAAEQCKGIIWLPNDGLGPNECKLLDKAELVREYKSNDDTANDELSEDDDQNAAQRRLQKKLDIEHARLAKRVCIEALKKEGVHSNDIWRVALKMMTVSRALLLNDKDRAVEAPSEEPSGVEQTDERVEEEEETSEESPEYVFDEYELFEPIAVGPFHPGAEHFEVNFPSLQQVQQVQQTNRHDKDVQSRKTKKFALSSQPACSGKGKAHPSSVPHSSRKREWRFGLPFAFWRQIIADAVGADGILSHQQQVRIITYAANWNAVSYELTIKGAEDHQQIWKFLETVKCITYSSLT